MYVDLHGTIPQLYNIQKQNWYIKFLSTKALLILQTVYAKILKLIKILNNLLSQLQVWFAFNIQIFRDVDIPDLSTHAKTLSTVLWCMLFSLTTHLCIQHLDMLGPNSHLLPVGACHILGENQEHLQLIIKLLSLQTPKQLSQIFRGHTLLCRLEGFRIRSLKLKKIGHLYPESTITKHLETLKKY